MVGDHAPVSLPQRANGVASSSTPHARQRHTATAGGPANSVAHGSLRLDHADYGFPSSQSVEDPLMAFGGLAEPQQLVDVSEASDLTVTNVPSNSAATQQQQTPPAVPIKGFFFTPIDKETTLRHLEAWAKRSESKKR